MKRKQLLASKPACSLVAIAIGGMLLASCADTYDGKDSFESSVRNATLESPDGSKIVITPNTNGDQMTITWPVVYGAGGYEFIIHDLTNQTVRKDTVDGCSRTIGRLEDTNYLLELRTLGNAQLGNSDAPTATEYAFNSFEASYAAIPEGDLYAWFQANPIPEDSVGMTLNYDLVPGGQYTLSGLLDFGPHTVTLRSTDKSKNASVTYGAEGGLATSSGFKAKYIDFDCAASTQPVLALSETPNPAIKDDAHNNHYQITDPVVFQGCNIMNVVRYLMYDNKVKYCVKTFNMTNCFVKLTPDDKMTTSAYFQIYDGGGFINDFTCTNCTFWGATTNKVNYFIRYNNSGRCDRAGYLTNSINLKNCTFYNIAKDGQMANHSGFDGRTTSNYDFTNNIFVDCGSGQVPRRFVGRQASAAVNNWGYNTYWFDGAPETEGFSTQTYDLSNNALQTDPAFVDAANGNFTPTGADQVARKTGDPRWLPASE